MSKKKVLKNTGGDGAGGLATFTIRANGSPIDPGFEVLSVRVYRNINEISGATIVLLESEAFDVSSSALFIPRTPISITAGYDGTESVLFSGVIASQSIRAGANGRFLEVNCRDKAVFMNVVKRDNSFIRETDSSVMTTIIHDYTELSATIQRTETIWPILVQHDTTDWAFILSRAEANRMFVTTLDGRVTVQERVANTPPVMTITYGDSLLEINAKLVGWEESGLINDDLSKVRGKVKIKGSNLAFPTNVVTLEGVGAKFSADHIVSGVVHEISDGNWTTELSIGLPPARHTGEPEEVSSGILPTARGLYKGIVKQISGDPDGQYRVLVKVPLMGAMESGIWARVSNFYATKGAGSFFLPEVNDEVVLGFLNEDPRYPVVMGSMYDEPEIKPHPDLNPDEKNSLKAIISRSGISVMFDDENKILSFATPNHNTIAINDKEKTIKLRDQNSNCFTMSDAGISIKSPKDINIEAGGRVNISGTQGITERTSGGDIAVSGMNISQTANLEFSATGNASAKVTGGMELTLKGSMVMIN